MTPEAADKRITLSDIVVSLYEREALYRGLNMSIQQRLMIEVKVLHSLAFEHPYQATRISRLVSRYNAVSIKLAAEHLERLARHASSASQTSPHPVSYSSVSTSPTSVSERLTSWLKAA